MSCCKDRASGLRRAFEFKPIFRLTAKKNIYIILFQ
jgi:hypothetical protein